MIERKRTVVVGQVSFHDEKSLVGGKVGNRQLRRQLGEWL